MDEPNFRWLQAWFSASLIDFLDLPEDVLVRKKTTTTGHNLFKADDSLLVDDKIGTLGAVSLFVIDAVGFDHFLSPRVTQEGVI